MLCSMTAFGRGEAQAGDYHFAVELRSVNHRFCDLQLRLPRRYAEFEEEIRKKLRSRFSRGRLELTVVADESLEKIRHLNVDLELARTYRKLLGCLQQELGLEGGLRLEALLNFRDIFVFQENEESRREAWRVLEMALEEAVSEWLQMRALEGRAIEQDFRTRLSQLDTQIGQIKARAPLVVQEARDRLQKRLENLLGEEVKVDEARLAQEVALLADRSDIAEEVVRCQSHLQQFRELLEAGGPRGRQLEFLLQELHREVNTIGAKANDLVIAQGVIQIKTELERLREQVQNIE